MKSPLLTNYKQLYFRSHKQNSTEFKESSTMNPEDSQTSDEELSLSSISDAPLSDDGDIRESSTTDEESSAFSCDDDVEDIEEEVILKDEYPLNLDYLMTHDDDSIMYELYDYMDSTDHDDWKWDTSSDSDQSTTKGSIVVKKRSKGRPMIKFSPEELPLFRKCFEDLDPDPSIPSSIDCFVEYIWNFFTMILNKYSRVIQGLLLISIIVLLFWRQQNNLNRLLQENEQLKMQLFQDSRNYSTCHGLLNDAQLQEQELRQKVKALVDKIQDPFTELRQSGVQ